MNLKFLFIKRFLLGIVVAIAIVLILSMGTLYFNRTRELSFKPQPTVSELQIRKVGQAVADYTKKHSRRPATLEALVNEGLLSPANLFDAERSETPALDETTGRFAVTPDVIYFPAIQPGDPGDCVLLCTVLLKDEDDPFLVIYNDGRYETLTNRQLVEALNRTYEHIGTARTKPAKSPLTKPSNQQ